MNLSLVLSQNQPTSSDTSWIVVDVFRCFIYLLLFYLFLFILGLFIYLYFYLLIYLFIFIHWLNFCTLCNSRLSFLCITAVLYTKNTRSSASSLSCYLVFCIFCAVLCCRARMGDDSYRDNKFPDVYNILNTSENPVHVKVCILNIFSTTWQFSLSYYFVESARYFPSYAFKKLIVNSLLYEVIMTGLTRGFRLK